MKKTLSAVMLTAALAMTAACGGGDDRPTADELSKTLTGKNNVLGTEVPQKAADCMAKVLEESDLSDKTLNALVDADKDYKNKKDEKTLQKLTPELGKCATAA